MFRPACVVQAQACVPHWQGVPVLLVPIQSKPTAWFLPQCKQGWMPAWSQRDGPGQPSTQPGRAREPANAEGIAAGSPPASKMQVHTAAQENVPWPQRASRKSGVAVAPQLGAAPGLQGVPVGQRLQAGLGVVALPPMENHPFLQMEHLAPP